WFRPRRTGSPAVALTKFGDPSGCGRPGWAGCCLSGGLLLFFLLDLVEAEDGLAPEGEDAAGQPAVEHERPVEPHREELLGAGVAQVDAVPPLVHRHLRNLGH